MRYKSLTAAVCAWLGLTPFQSHAQVTDLLIQDSRREYRQFEKVELTGSTVLSKDTKNTLAVRVITRQDLQRMGIQQLPDLVNALSDQINFQNSGQLAGGNDLAGPDSAAIHGLQSGTLILLNGRRLPYYGLQSLWGERAVVDLNLLPLSAIEKVEVMPTGASSRYGADAISGVINIITHNTNTENQLTLEAGMPQQAGGQSRRFNASWGTGNFFRDGFSFQMHWESSQKDTVLAANRSTSLNGLVPVAGTSSWIGKNASPYSSPANVLSASGVVLPLNGNSASCPSDRYLIQMAQGTECWANTQRWMSLYPQLKKHQFFAQAEKALSPEHALFAEVLVGQQEQKFNNLPPVTADLALPDGEVALFSADYLGPVQRQIDTQNHRITLGLKGNIQDWDYLFSAYTGLHQVNIHRTNNIPTNKQLNELGLTKAELLTPASDYTEATRTKFNAIRDDSWSWVQSGQTRLSGLQLQGSTEILNTENGPWLFGGGFSMIQESSQSRFWNADWQEPYDLSRRLAALHGEMQIPVSSQVSILSALRQDHYSDFGSVMTGKFGGKWQIEPQWFLRASVGNGFRAPTLAQLSKNQAKIGYFEDPNGSLNTQVYAQGNPALQPERSWMTQLGGRWEPHANASLGAELWSLKKWSTFGNLSIDQILNDPQLKSQYVHAENGVNAMYLQAMNLGQRRMMGLDLDGAWRIATDWGFWRTQFQMTRYLRSETQLETNGPWFSDLGSFQMATGQYIPKYKSKLAITAERPNQWSVTAHWDYLSGNKETVDAYDFANSSWQSQTRTVPDFWTVNLLASWRPSTPWTLQFQVYNLFDRAPPLRLALPATTNLTGIDTRYANYEGRVFKANIKFKF